MLFWENECGEIVHGWQIDPYYTTLRLTFRSSCEVGLSSGSFLRQTEMKSRKRSDQFSARCNLGGSFCAM